MALWITTSLATNTIHRHTHHKIFSKTYTIQYPDHVNNLLNQINPQNMWENLMFLTMFPDRGADHDTGKQAAIWIKNQIEVTARKYGRNDVSVFFINTRHEGRILKQPSVIAKIGTSEEPGIVIGAHLDTVYCEGYGCPEKNISPGADDDGSGTVTVLETARTLIASNLHFQKPIYLIWYAAEESGSLGSEAVVNYFQKNRIPIYAVTQFDQTGYSFKNDPTIWLFNSHTLDYDSALTKYMETLINTYIKQPVKYTHGGCSDELIWINKGYAVARAAEADYANNQSNPDTHGSTDTIDKLSLSHMADYLKLAIAFAVELAEPLDR